jgi:hypothetical protein
MMQNSQFWVGIQNSRFRKVQEGCTRMFTVTLLTAAKRYKKKRKVRDS